MRKVLCILFILASPAGAQPPRDVVQRAISAHGGTDALAKTKAMTQVAKGRFNFGGIDVEATREGKFALPERVAWTIEFQREGIRQRVLIGLAGFSGWQQSPPQPAVDLPPAAYDTIAEEAHAHWLCTVAPLSDKSVTVSAAPGATVDGQPADGVKVTRPGKPEVALYFSKATGLLVKAQFRGREGGPGKETVKEWLFGGHKDFSGVKLPTKITELQSGTRVGAWEVTECRFVDKFDAAAFKKPG
jgi:hypothetical protein